MACATGTLGVLHIKVGTGHDFTAGTIPQFEIVSESLRKSETLIDTSGITGSRSRLVDSYVSGTYSVSGSIVINPSKADLDTWLPIIMGTAEGGGDSYELADALGDAVSVFAVQVYRAAGAGTKTFEYTECKVNRAIFRGSVNQVISLELEVFGKTEIFEGDAAASTGLTSNLANQPYVFHQGVLTYGGSGIPYQSFELTIDNLLEAKFNNTSAGATDICPTDRLVTLSCDADWDDTTATEYDQDDVAGTFVLTNSTNVTTFTFGKLIQSAQAPTIANKSFIRWPLTLEARKDGATMELAVTNVEA